MDTVIYHAADFDGIFCREIARHFLGSPIMKGWNFGDAKIPMPSGGQVYILDLSPECLDVPDVELDDPSRVIWIDHHKTAIEKFSSEIPGYRIDGVAACRLAWQWFSDDNFRRKHAEKLPSKEAYIDRQVKEPLPVRLAGEHDVWARRDERAEQLQYGLRCFDNVDFEKLLTEPDDEGVGTYLFSILLCGDAAQRYAKNVDASIVNTRSFLVKWEGLTWLALNTARCNSTSFAARDMPETGHDALLGYFWNGKQWTVSLYGANHRPDIDLSTIAKKHGGGGHRQACGFQTVLLPPFHYADQQPIPCN